jgi:hypothetical protein
MAIAGLDLEIAPQKLTRLAPKASVRLRWITAWANVPPVIASGPIPSNS